MEGRQGQQEGDDAFHKQGVCTKVRKNQVSRQGIARVAARISRVVAQIALLAARIARVVARIALLAARIARVVA